MRSNICRYARRNVFKRNLRRQKRVSSRSRAYEKCFVHDAKLGVPRTSRVVGAACISERNGRPCRTKSWRPLKSTSKPSVCLGKSTGIRWYYSRQPYDWCGLRWRVSISYIYLFDSFSLNRILSLWVIYDRTYSLIQFSVWLRCNRTSGNRKSNWERE